MNQYLKYGLISGLGIALSYYFYTTFIKDVKKATEAPKDEKKQEIPLVDIKPQEKAPEPKPQEKVTEEPKVENKENKIETPVEIKEQTKIPEKTIVKIEDKAPEKKEEKKSEPIKVEEKKPEQVKVVEEKKPEPEKVLEKKKIVEEKNPQPEKKKTEKKDQLKKEKEDEGFVLVKSGHSQSENKIFTPKVTNFDSWVILLFAKYNGIKYETFEIPDKEIQESELLKTKTPLGIVPFLETPEGTLWQLNTILKHFGQDKITPFVESWMEYLLIEVSKSILPLNEIYLQLQPSNKITLKKCGEELEEPIQLLEEALKSGYLVGDKQTLADVYGVALFWKLFEKHFDTEFCNSHPNLTNWVKNVSSEPNFKLVLGELKFKQPKKVEVVQGIQIDHLRKFYTQKKPSSESVSYFWGDLSNTRRVNSFFFSTNKEKMNKTEIENFIQTLIKRCEGNNKNIFARLYITEDKDGESLKIFWLFNGHNEPENLKTSPEYEKMIFKRGDWKADKNRVDDYLSGDMKIEGNKIIEAFTL